MNVQVGEVGGYLYMLQQREKGERQIESGGREKRKYGSEEGEVLIRGKVCKLCGLLTNGVKVAESMEVNDQCKRKREGKEEK